MLKKRQTIIVFTIALSSFLMGTMFIVVTMAKRGRGGNPFDKIWEAVDNLQARVSSLEEATHNKTWHFVTSFNLSIDDKPFSPTFSVQGEKWRISWSRAGQTISVTTRWFGFIVYNGDGYVIDTFDLRPVISGYPGKGIYYVISIPGNYHIELRNVGMDGISFSIDSYH